MLAATLATQLDDAHVYVDDVRGLQRSLVVWWLCRSVGPLFELYNLY